MTYHVCIEGGEGTYKTTTIKALVDYYSRSLRVLSTKEPGVPLLPSTMVLREVMLSNIYDSELTRQARELISQAIRSIHNNWLEQVRDDFDLIIQDRGILSDRIYAYACGNEPEEIELLETYIRSIEYDLVIIFHNEGGLELARSSKNEFGNGDAMESRGEEFHRYVSSQFRLESNSAAKHTYHIEVNGLTTLQIVDRCIAIIDKHRLSN